VKKRLTDPLFQLASYNWFIDHQTKFPNSTLKIILLVFRQTCAYQKERDFIRYGFIKKKTGLATSTISPSVKWLIENNYLERLDEKGNLIKKIKKGSRARIFYRLTDVLYQKLDEYYSKNWKTSVTKNGTATVPKTGTYKKKTKQKEVFTNKKYLQSYKNQIKKGDKDSYAFQNYQPPINKYST